MGLSVYILGCRDSDEMQTQKLNIIKASAATALWFTAAERGALRVRSPVCHCDGFLCIVLLIRELCHCTLQHCPCDKEAASGDIFLHRRQRCYQWAVGGGNIRGGGVDWPVVPELTLGPWWRRWRRWMSKRQTNEWCPWLFLSVCQKSKLHINHTEFWFKSISFLQ